MDPGIPSHPRGRPAAITWGKFVDYGDTVELVDRTGNRWKLERVQFAYGFFGFSEDGSVHLPRPEKYDGDTVVIEGDRVMIFFMEGSPNRPVVSGGIRSIKLGDFKMSYNHESDEADPNKLRGRLRNLNASGVATGEVRWSANDTQAGALDAFMTAFATFQKVTRVSDPEYTMRSETFLTDLSASLSEIVAFAAGLAVPLPNTSAMITKIATSQGVGAPYISRTLKSE